MLSIVQHKEKSKCRSTYTDKQPSRIKEITHEISKEKKDLKMLKDMQPTKKKELSSTRRISLE